MRFVSSLRLWARDPGRLDFPRALFVEARVDARAFFLEAAGRGRLVERFVALLVLRFALRSLRAMSPPLPRARGASA